MNKTILAVAACMLLTASAKAAPSAAEVIDEAYKLCMNNAQPDKSMMTECAMEAEENWDKHIAETYNRLMGALEMDPYAQNELKKEQSNWLAHRSGAFDAMDAACANSTVRVECNATAAASKAKFVRARAITLDKALQDAAGGNSFR